jgi:hypothetical protein
MRFLAKFVQLLHLFPYRTNILLLVTESLYELAACLDGYNCVHVPKAGGKQCDVP